MRVHERVIQKNYFEYLKKEKKILKFRVVLMVTGLISYVINILYINDKYNKNEK